MGVGEEKAGFIDLWKNPIRGTWPVWGFTVVACFCTLLGSDWSFGGIILAVTSMVFNGMILAVVLFKKPSPEYARVKKVAQVNV